MSKLAHSVDWSVCIDREGRAHVVMTGFEPPEMLTVDTCLFLSEAEERAEIEQERWAEDNSQFGLGA